MQILKDFALIGNSEGKLLLIQREDGRWSLPGDRPLTKEEERLPSTTVLARIVQEQTGKTVKLMGDPDADIVIDPDNCRWTHGTYADHTTFRVCTWRCWESEKEASWEKPLPSQRYVDPYELMVLAQKGNAPGGLIGGMEQGLVDEATIGQLVMCLDFFLAKTEHHEIAAKIKQGVYERGS